MGRQMDHTHQAHAQAPQSGPVALSERFQDQGLDQASHTNSGQRAFYAYETHPQEDMPITPAPVEREWMDATHVRFAYRCLPILIANQAGWFIHNPIDFSAVWDGGNSLKSLQIQFGSKLNGTTGQQTTSSPEPEKIRMFNRPELKMHDSRISSHFGHGILTFAIPYLFRTPQAVNLWVKGPTNYVKDGICPLEGIVETDWLSMTFTMNWKFTRPNHPVSFSCGEPICMVVPVPRDLAEKVQPIRLPIESNSELNHEYRTWEQSRSSFNKGLKQPDSEAFRQRWQKHYFKGESIVNVRATEHQTRVNLKEFVRRSTGTGDPHN